MSVEITPRFFRSGHESWLSRFMARLDWQLMGAALALALMGLFFIYSATFRSGHGNSYLVRQSVGIVIGLLGMLFFVALPYQVLQTYARWVYGFSIALLIGVLIFGARLRGSRSWFDLHFFYFQPVEITRLALTVAVAAYADAYPRGLREWQGLIVPLLMAGLHLGLILLQPDLSSAIVLGPMMLALLFAAEAPVSVLVAFLVMGGLALGIPLADTYFTLAGDHFQGHPILALVRSAFLGKNEFYQVWAGFCGVLCVGWWFLRKWRVLIPGAALLCALAVIVSGVGGSFMVKKALKDYQRKRLIAFVDPALDPLGAGYNILQSEIAIGSGRFFGKGYLSGSQTQLGFLPEKHNDFIFSLVAEELGFVGALFVLLVFFSVAWRAYDIAGKARDRFGRYLAISLGTFFAFSGFINIGMVMGLMPVTGLPLPFLSYGGSSIVGAFLAVGILLSIHLRRYIL
ncbi:MAG: rod shape-determining protein RodA [Elusimicrobia bacterium]|nr:rod shape-determining protein RodA [Elusimicrobiota bacterium]